MYYRCRCRRRKSNFQLVRLVLDFVFYAHVLESRELSKVISNLQVMTVVGMIQQIVLQTIVLQIQLEFDSIIDPIYIVSIILFVLSFHFNQWQYKMKQIVTLLYGNRNAVKM